MSTYRLASLVQSKLPKVSIIILNWNGWQDTLECLDSLAQIAYPNHEVIVVDNGSTNESIVKLKVQSEKLKVENKNFKLIENKENLGFAGGNNVGIKYALEKKTDYILLLNNDTVVAPDFLDKLVEAGEKDKNFGIIGPKIYYEADKKRIWFAGGHFSWLGGGRHMECDKLDADPREEKIKEVDYMTGCCFLIKHEVIEKIGLMNEDFFLYYEDTEWSLRARKYGYKIIYASISHIWHKVSRSAKPKTNFKVYYYHIRNALLLSKLRAPKYLLGGIYIWSIGCYLKQIFKIVFFPAKREIAKMIMRGIEDFYKGNFGIYSLR